MYPYLITFLISILLCAAAERVMDKSRVFSGLFLGASVLVPVLLAGARDYSVGTDITTYGNYVFSGAGNARDLWDYLNSWSNIEPLYRALAFGVSRFTNNAHWFYLVTALIICGFTMAGLVYYRRWCSLTLGWACFLFLFYGDTLNTMRQCLALALVFFAFPMLLEKKYVLYAVLQAAAILFHVTGAIALCIPLLYLIMRRMPPLWLQFFFIIGFMTMILIYSPLLRVVMSWKILPAKFSRYIASGVAFALKPTILRLPFLVPIVLYYDRFCGFGLEQLCDEELGGTLCDTPGGTLRAGTDVIPGVVSDISGGTPCTKTPSDTLRPGAAAKMERERFKGHYSFGMFVVLALLLEICTVQLRSVKPALYRISYYFGYYRFIAYPRLVRILRKDNRALVTAALILYLLVLWYYQNVIQGNNEVIPYLYDPRWFWRKIPVWPPD